MSGIVQAFQRLVGIPTTADKQREEEEREAKKVETTLIASALYTDLANLREELEGKIILPSDGEAYHSCRRRAFNHNQRGYPLVIVRVQSRKDVVACIHFVNKHRKEINLCVACGCHSSKCMMDGAFVIDLFHFNKVELDLENLVIKVDGGAYLEEIDKVLQPHNLGVTVGTYPQTGVGGLTLGGGFGFLGRWCGFSVDNMLGAEVVLHTGEVVRASDEENQDLMWALRGGSGNFGVVTQFVFRVHKLPSRCISGTIAHLTPTQSAAVTVATNFDNLMSGLPECMAAFLVFPGGAPVVPTLWAHFGEENSPSEVPILQQAAKLGGWLTVQNNVQVNSYHKHLQTITTPLIEQGHIYHSLIQFGSLDATLPADFWTTLLTFTRAKLDAKLVKATLLAFAMGGKMATSDPDGTKTCLTQSIRKSRYFGIIEICWNPDFGEDGKNAARDWAKQVIEILKPHCNELLRYAATDNSVDTPFLIEKDQAGYGTDRYPKLRDIKKKYDPTNMFLNNVNIAPAE